MLRSLQSARATLLYLILSVSDPSLAFTSFTGIGHISFPENRPGRLSVAVNKKYPTNHNFRRFVDIATNAEALAGRFEEPDNLKEAEQIKDELDISSVVNGSTSSYKDTTKRLPFVFVLWKFTRPHTLIGSALAIPALHVLAAPSLGAAFSAKALSVMLYTMIPALLMNLYITGLNQITDIEIDKVNKPYLPIPAGLLSVRDAIFTVVVSLIASLWMGMAHPFYGTEGLNVALWGSGILGTLYSLRPIRLKRFPLLAAFCIIAVRGAIINASFFAHSAAAAYGQIASSASGGSSILYCLKNNRACFLSSLFFAVFGLVIALMKDVPDVLGDRRANVRTFSVRIGQKRVFHGMRWLLSGLFFIVGGSFLSSAYVAPTWALTVGRIITGSSSIWAGLSVNRQSRGVDPEDSQQVYDYYMHLWKLFYLSYFALPFAR